MSQVMVDELEQAPRRRQGPASAGGPGRPMPGALEGRRLGRRLRGALGLGMAAVLLLSACQRRDEVPAPERGALPDQGASSPWELPSSAASAPGSSDPGSAPFAYPGSSPGSAPWPASSASPSMP